jgi:hypothetical protein
MAVMFREIPQPYRIDMVGQTWALGISHLQTIPPRSVKIRKSFDHTWNHRVHSCEHNRVQLSGMGSRFPRFNFRTLPTNRPIHN